MFPSFATRGSRRAWSSTPSYQLPGPFLESPRPQSPRGPWERPPRDRDAAVAMEAPLLPMDDGYEDEDEFQNIVELDTPYVEPGH